MINIGVPRDHPLADTSAQVGDSGLYNMRIGNLRLPPAPQLVVNIRRQADQDASTRQGVDNRGFGINVAVRDQNSTAEETGGDVPNEQEQRVIEQQVDRITTQINRMLGVFQQLFSSH